MGLFSKIKHVFKKAESAGTKLFTKGQVGGAKIFGKGSIASKIVSKTSKGLNQVSGVTKQIGAEVGKFAEASAPVLSMLGPVGEGVLGAATGLSAGLKGVSEVAGLGAEATKQKGYSGSAGQVASSILEKGKNIHDQAQTVQFHG